MLLLCLTDGENWWAGLVVGPQVPRKMRDLNAAFLASGQDHPSLDMVGDVMPSRRGRGQSHVKSNQQLANAAGSSVTLPSLGREPYHDPFIMKLLYNFWN